MKRALALSFLACWTPSANAKLTTTSDAVGKFTIITKIDDISDTPIMHAPLVTKEVRLEWRSLDRRLLFFLKDDGVILTGGFEFLKSDLSDLVCASYGGKLYSYNPRAGISKQWLGHLGEPAKQFGKACARALGMQQVGDYDAEFDRAEPDFALALEAMKTAAQQQFGPRQRPCVWFARSTGPKMQCTPSFSGTN